MVNQNKIKGLGIALCIIAAVLLLFSGYLIVSPNQSKGNKKEIDNAQATSEASTAEEDTSAENEEEQQSAHEINPDVYEWPCGKESFQYMEESEDVIYFAKK